MDETFKINNMYLENVYIFISDINFDTYEAKTNDSHFTNGQIHSTALTCAFTGIFPTHSHDTPFTIASCGTTVAGMRNFSTLVQFPVPFG